MSSKRVVVDLFYDVISPYSWIGFELLCRYRPQWKSMELKFKPFLLGGVFKETGNSGILLVANKARYLYADLQRVSPLYGIPLVIPQNFAQMVLKGPNWHTLRGMRFITAINLITSGKSTEDISRQLWKRVFVSHQDVTLPDSFREAAKKCDISEDIVEKAIVFMEQKEVKESLRKTTEEAISFGAFGAPTAVIHLPTGPELVFGSDRMEIIGSLLGEKYVGPLNHVNKP